MLKKRLRLHNTSGSDSCLDNFDGEFSYKFDPFSLEEGDYVVHKKVGICRFMAIRPSLPEASVTPVDYVYIQYADGVAKLVNFLLNNHLNISIAIIFM